jgi:cysteinyl-tRNA synthetase
MADSLRFYNTLTRRKEAFEPLEPGKVRMYNCGPTVYMYATIGNFRSFIFADILRRYLEYKGLTVTQVMNITDVGHLTEDSETGEDKLEKTAREQKVDPWKIAEHYTKAFFEDIDHLGIQRATHYPKATDHVTEMIHIIETLIERGHAYVSNNCVYYAISSYPKYGEISGNPLDELMPGARLEVNPDKRDPRDFALWVTDPKHLMRWESPWGVGYPYWHVECSAMAMKYLGESIDIHTGGEDNIFPHHECERAQSEGATGKPFVKYWLHARFLLVDGRKMSKSLGNFYTLRDLVEKGYDPVAIRYELLDTHYRQPLNFTLDGVTAAAESIRRLRDFQRNLEFVVSAGAAGADDTGAHEVVERAAREFENAMDDDLNTSAGCAAIFNMARDINKLKVGAAGATAALAQLRRFDRVLNILGETKSATLDEEVERLIQERQDARKRRDFKRADEVRDLLKQKGIVLEDTPQGVRWKRGS